MERMRLASYESVLPLKRTNAFTRWLMTALKLPARGLLLSRTAFRLRSITSSRWGQTLTARVLIPASIPADF